MALDLEDRGLLDSLIDNMVKKLPDFVRAFRAEERKYQIKNEEDFMLGWAHGRITATFSAFRISKKGQSLTVEEANQVERILQKRMGELRSAIFEAG
jgi:hypothetical protein